MRMGLPDRRACVARLDGARQPKRRRNIDPIAIRGIGSCCSPAPNQLAKTQLGAERTRIPHNLCQLRGGRDRIADNRPGAKPLPPIGVVPHPLVLTLWTFTGPVVSAFAWETQVEQAGSPLKGLSQRDRAADCRVEVVHTKGCPLRFARFGPRQRARRVAEFASPPSHADGGYLIAKPRLCERAETADQHGATAFAL